MDRLTDVDLARMRAEHACHACGGLCAECLALESCYPYEDYCEGCLDPWPCDAARLLAHFAPGTVPHLASVAVGLLGPVTSEELPGAD